MRVDTNQLQQAQDTLQMLSVRLEMISQELFDILSVLRHEDFGSATIPILISLNQQRLSAQSRSESMRAMANVLSSIIPQYEECEKESDTIFAFDQPFDFSDFIVRVLPVDLNTYPVLVIEHTVIERVIKDYIAPLIITRKKGSK